MLMAGPEFTTGENAGSSYFHQQQKAVRYAASASFERASDQLVSRCMQPVTLHQTGARKQGVTVVAPER